MREILFRGKTEKGEWKEGMFVKDFEIYGKEDEHSYIVTHKHPSGCFGSDIYFEVIPETVGQYTGLTDKNGKKIFEGDIVLFEDESPTNYEYHDSTEMRCGEVKFDCGSYYLTNRIAVEMDDLIYYEKLDGAIVGNIHDNPELLKGGE